MHRRNLKVLIPRLLVQSAAWVLVSWLVQGCAVVTSPGFDYADPKLRSSVMLGQYVLTDANNPPQGVITPITPALVRAQYQSRPITVGPEVQRLFGEPAAYTIGPGEVNVINGFFRIITRAYAPDVALFQLAQCTGQIGDHEIGHGLGRAARNF